MVHGIEQLVLVDKATDHEIDEAEEEHEPGAGKHAVDCANHKDKDCLGKVEPVAEDGGLT